MVFFKNWRPPLRLESFFWGGILGLTFFPLPAIQVVIPLALTRFLLLLDRVPPRWRLRFLFLWAFFFGYFFVSIYWVYNALLLERHLFYWLIPFCVVGVPAYLGAAMAGAVQLSLSVSFSSVVKPDPSPVGTLREKFREFVRTSPLLRKMDRFFSLAVVHWILCGLSWYWGEEFMSETSLFPWVFLGNTWSSCIPVAQLSLLDGPVGLSFLTFLAGTLPYLWLTTRPKVYYKSATLGLVAVLVVLVGLGASRVLRHPPGYQDIQLQVIQPNFPLLSTHTVQQKVAAINTLLQMSESPDPSVARIVIWPESALENYLEDFSGTLQPIIGSFLGPQGVLISGAYRRTPHKESYNSIFVLDGKGAVRAVYDKYHLVPFGEYLPWRPLWERLFSKEKVRTITGAVLDFSRGPGPRVLRGDFPPFCPLICYEAIFSGQVCPCPDGSPEWILNVSEDGWFGKSGGPYQHFEMARMRAIEEGLPLVRCANSGISAVIDPYGRVLASLPLGTRGQIWQRLPKPIPSFARARDTSEGYFQKLLRNFTNLCCT